MKIKDISPENRPRERLEKYDASTLSDAEILALILKTGNKDENVIDMANRLISKYGIDKLSSCSLKELQEIKGIGKAKASQILALFEFTKRYRYTKKAGKQIRSSEDVFNYFSTKFLNYDRECFMTLHLDTKNRVVKEEIISIGILDASIIHPRELFKSAIKESANSIIIVHNHPSGDPTPSKEDQEITEQIMKAGKLLEIEVLDHLIIGENSYYSFRDNL